jgi:hypothetical protein
MDEQVEAAWREANADLARRGYDLPPSEASQFARIVARAVLRSLPGSEAREVAKELRRAPVTGISRSRAFDLADRLDRAPSPNNSKDRQTLGVREGPTREQIIEAITPTLGAWLKLTGLHVPKIAGQCADAVLALYPSEGEGE